MRVKSEEIGLLFSQLGQDFIFHYLNWSATEVTVPVQSKYDPLAELERNSEQDNGW